MASQSDIFDVLIIGGGINGAGIARDASGRGLKVALVEAGDFGGATSSASTKLIHGGLRYLEFYEFGLVRKALKEREVLLDIAPHISWPQSFVLPSAPERPDWKLRAGLFLYDHLARRKVVPGSNRIDLRQDRAGRALESHYTHAFRYWDGWVDDARLVIANIADAAARGAYVRSRTRVTTTIWDGSAWTVALSDGTSVAAKTIVNTAGPWAEEVARSVMGRNDAPSLRLVQGSHIVTRRVHLGRDAFMLQQPDGRIIFVLPYEHDFSLIGTTERSIDTPAAAHITEEETDYLIAAVNRYLARPLTLDDIVHRFSGVRPLILEAGGGIRALDAKFSLQYVLARALLDGHVSLAHFEGQAHADARVQAWLPRIEVAAYDDSQFAHSNHFGGAVRLTLDDGTVLEASVEQALGRTSAHPLPQHLLEAKFALCAASVLQADAVEAVAAAVCCGRSIG